MDKHRIALIIFFIGVVVGIAVVHSRAIDEKESEAPEENPGLYNSSDRVFVLNDTNFKKNVYDGKRAWMVEFYNSWCGFCHRFAPIWKNLASSIHGWRDIVVVAAVDCANEDNTPLCRNYEVMSYPSIKFFPVSTNEDFLGHAMNKNDDINRMIESLVNILIDEQLQQRGGSSWPNIAPYRGAEPEKLWQTVPTKTQYEFLIFEEPKSHQAAEVILDLHKLDTIIIRRVTSENVPFSVTHKITKFPSIIAIDRDNSETLLKIDSSTREGIRNAIITFLKSKNISTDIKDENFDEVNEDNIKKSVAKTHNLPKKSNHDDDKLYRLDLETALHKALNNEIPRVKVITGEKLEALKTFLKVIALYFPVHSPKTKIYLYALKEYVESKNNITGKEFKEQVKLKEREHQAAFSEPKIYIGCKGSEPSYRGYPCGLWTMFHTLSVAAAEFDYVNDNDHPSVLTAMHGYIKNFFGCADCANHFQEMSKERNIFESRSADDSVMWLWRAHNQVNERLAGDETEDPEHKKIQYPSSENCPKCRSSSGDWNENEVLRYLKKKYNKSNISEDLGDSELINHQDNDNIGLTSGASIRKLGWDFTIFDISICVVLYATSALILILVFIKFAFKRTTRKKVPFTNLFNVKVK